MTPQSASKTPDHLLTPDEVAEMLQVPKSTLYNWRTTGDGPPAARIGRHLRYSLIDVERWVASRTTERSNASRGRGA